MIMKPSRRESGGREDRTAQRLQAPEVGSRSCARRHRDTRRLRSASTLSPAPRCTFVRSAEEGERCLYEDAQVEQRRAVLDVPDIELDALVPWERRTAVHLGPAGDPGLYLETTS